RDPGVAAWLPLRPGGGVEVRPKERTQIAGIAVLEKGLLGLDTTGGEDGDADALIAPALQSGRDIRVHLALALARAIPLLPDLSLQGLEAGGLAVTIHQPVDVHRHPAGVVPP